MIDAIISALNSLAATRATNAASAAHALRFELADTESITTAKGYVAIHGVSVQGVQTRVSLGYDPERREWIMTDLEPLDILIDRSRHLGSAQALHPLPTGEGYAITFETSALMTLTASRDTDRLQTLSVRLNR